jgi:hypothetical protein
VSTGSDFNPKPFTVSPAAPSGFLLALSGDCAAPRIAATKQNAQMTHDAAERLVSNFIA